MLKVVGETSVYLKIDELLESNNLTAYKLAKLLSSHETPAEKRVHQTTVYDYVGNKISRFDKDVLARLMWGLEALIGQTIAFDDVFYRAEQETREILDDYPQLLEDLEKLERGEIKLIPWEDVQASLDADE